MCYVFSTAAYLNTGIILESEGNLEEAKRTFLTCTSIPDENLKDPHAHQSAVTSCLYNLGKMLHGQGQQEVAMKLYCLAKDTSTLTFNDTFYSNSQSRAIRGSFSHGLQVARMEDPV